MLAWTAEELCGGGVTDGMNAYQALGVAEDASSDEIRHAYHRLARCHHPDSAGTSADTEAFDSIQRAWEQLRDSNARSLHDARLRAQELADVQLGSRIDEVDLDDMEYTEDAAGAGCWRLGCRCGDEFVLREEDLANGIEVLQCSSCSLSIRPLYSVEEGEDEEEVVEAQKEAGGKEDTEAEEAEGADAAEGGSIEATGAASSTSESSPEVQEAGIPQHDVLPPLLAVEPLGCPCPSEVDRLVREWIGKARRGQPAGSAEEKALERLKHLFGVLELAPRDGGSEAWASLQVFVQLTQFQKARFVFLHFYPSTERDRQRGTVARLPQTDRKEAGFIYFDAANGALHGIHLAPGQRGLGLSKPCVLYYLLVCRRFGLEARATAHNRKPLFAKLYAELGYQPRCADFPFLLLHNAPEPLPPSPPPPQAEPPPPPTPPPTPPPQTVPEAPPPPRQPQPHNHGGQLSYVVPLAATNPRTKPRAEPETRPPRPPPALSAEQLAALARLGLAEAPPTLAALQRAWKLRFTACHPDKGGSVADAQAVTEARDRLHRALFPHEAIEPDMSWTFTQRLAKSQDIVVVGDQLARLAEPGAIGRTTMLYAKTEWWLPDDAAVARRDAMLAEVAGAEGGGERVRCKVYEVDGGTARSGVVDE